MAIRITLESFLAVLQRSGLIAKDSVDASLRSFKESGGSTKEARPFAEYLLAQKDLTRWQAEKLLQGKHKGFFLGRYKLLDLLGKGGMSSVYLAEHTLMRRRCAIKVLPAKWVKTDTSYLGRFHREAQAVAALDHPNIVRAYDVDHEVDNDMQIHFLVMEYVEGKNLVDLIVERGPLPVREAVEYIRQASLGVGHAHRAGLVHRDIKPGNLLVDSSGTVKILDLGLAKFFSGDEASLTVQHDERVLGTADYLAPEQAVDSHSVDSRADIYSLGCTLYFLLTGRPPFNEGTLAQRLISHQTKEPTTIESQRNDVPEDLLMLIRKMMAKNPEERYQTAEEAARDLAAWLTKTESQSTGLPTTAPTKQSNPLAAKIASGAPPSRQPKEIHEKPSKKPAASSNPKVSSTRHNTAADVVAAEDTRAGTLVDENDVGSFLAQLDASALETDVRDSSSLRGKETATTNINHQSSDQVPVSTTSAQQSLKSRHLKETDPDLLAIPRAPEAPQAANDSETALSNTQQVAVGSSTTRLLRQKPKRSLKAPLIIGAALLGLSLILVLSGVFSNGTDEPIQNTPDDTTQVDPEVSPENANAGRPRPVAGEPIRVGAEGHFLSISEAIEYVRLNFRNGVSVDQPIVVATGTYRDRIVIDNSLRLSIPRGVRIVCEDAEPAVLNPTGSEPVIALDGVEGITIENFVVEAGDRAAAVHVGGYSLNTQLRRLRIQGVTGVGIAAVGASGLSGQRLGLDDIDVVAASTEAIGLRCTADLLDTQHIDLINCRFLGPMRIGVEFATKTWNVTLRQCIFDQCRSAVSFTGTTPDLQNVAFINNTFHAYQRAIVFQDTPLTNSRQNQQFQFVRNLFVNGNGRELDFEKAYNAEMGARLLANQRFNWSERAAPADPSTELDIFSAGGHRGEEVAFLSSSPDDADFLRPAGPELRQAVTEPADGYDYIGAVSP